MKMGSGPCLARIEENGGLTWLKHKSIPKEVCLSFAPRIRKWGVWYLVSEHAER